MASSSEGRQHTPVRTRSPPEAAATVRQRLAEALREGPATAKDLSKLVGISEHEVAGHLAHLARSLRARGERLAMTPPECLGCGFAFPGRERTTRPSHCPRCRGRRITLPEFRVE
jgi:predicted Zn-ribbon and HTH transcriptional regulator